MELIYYPHFTDQETKLRKVKFRELQSLEVAKRNLNLGLSGSKVMLILSLLLKM